MREYSYDYKIRRLNENVYNEYIDGNTVRKPERRPERKTRTYVDNKRVNTSANVLNNRERATRLSLASVLLIILCIVPMTLSAVVFISMNESVKAKKEAIAKNEIKLQSLKAQNDSVSYANSAVVDTNEIINIAVNELGMVQAGRGQIIFYDKTESEYMKQYKDLPR